MLLHVLPICRQCFVYRHLFHSPTCPSGIHLVSLASVAAVQVLKSNKGLKSYSRRPDLDIEKKKKVIGVGLSSTLDQGICGVIQASLLNTRGKKHWSIFQMLSLNLSCSCSHVPLLPRKTLLHHHRSLCKVVVGYCSV